MKVKNLYWLLLVFVAGFIACGVFPFVIFQGLYTTDLVVNKPSELWYLSTVIVSLVYCLGFVLVCYFGEKYLSLNKRKK